MFAYLFNLGGMRRIYMCHRALHQTRLRNKNKELKNQTESIFSHYCTLWLTCRETKAALASQMLRRAEQRALGPVGIRQGWPTQPAAAATAAEVAADRRAVSNSNMFEAGADSGRWQGE
jgi:hypothetical protein